MQTYTEIDTYIHTDIHTYIHKYRQTYVGEFEADGHVNMCTTVALGSCYAHFLCGCKVALCQVVMVLMLRTKLKQHCQARMLHSRAERMVYGQKQQT